MIPTINGLVKIKITPSNDNGREDKAIVERMDTVMSKVAEVAANDAQDIYEKTINRIMDKHNGHGRKYRDERGKFISREKAAANDKIDAYEKTLDRIMARHNNHDEAPVVASNDDFDSDKMYESTIDRIMTRHNGHNRKYRDENGRFISMKMAAQNENRIIHDYPLDNPDNDTLVLTDKVEGDKSKLSDDREKENNTVLLNPEQDKRRKEHNKEDEEVVQLLKSIDNNTLNTVDITKHIAHILEDMTGVDSLRAREKEIESGHDTIASSKESISSMDQKGKENWLEDLIAGKIGGKKKLVAAAVVGTIGLVGKGVSALLPGDDTLAPGGGHDSSQQKPENRSSSRDRVGGKVPAPEPRAPAIKPDSNVAVPIGKAPVNENATSAGRGYAPATAIPTPVRGDKAFQKQVTRVAKKYNVSEDDLYRVMAFESMGTFSPSVRNEHGATGLIQFMPSTAKELGTSTDELAKMSRAEQMNYVDKYFATHRLKKAKKPTVDDLYLTIFKPKAVGRGPDYVHTKKGSLQWERNPALSRQDSKKFGGNEDGVLTSSEVTSAVREYDMRKLGVPSNRGSKLNQMSASNSSKPNVVVVNQNNNQKTTNVNQSKQEHPKLRVPSPRSSWTGYLSYFGLTDSRANKY